MQTISTTRWLDEVNHDLSTVESLLLSHHPDELSETSTSYANWKIEKKFFENKSVVFNGKTIQYNYYSYSVDQIPIGMRDDEDATVRKTGFVIPYISSDRIRYIISRNTGALTLLRKMLSYSGKNEIVKNDFKFNADLFVWLISKVYNGENFFESGSDALADLTIDSVRGFKGNTEDLLTKVSAVGESVMNIISTLSFFLESQNLNQITLDISYREHSNIEVTLSNRNTVATSDERYLGDLLKKCEKEEIISTIVLLLYTEIIPIIIQNYQSEVEGNQWTQNQCVNFLKKVASDLSEKVTKRVDDLISRPEQLKMSFSTDEAQTDAS